MKIIFGLALIICVAGVVCVGGILSSPKAMQGVMMAGGKAFLKGLTVRELVIESQTYDFPARVTLRGVSGVVQQGAGRYEFRFKAVRLSNALSLFFSNAGIMLELHRGSVKAADVRLDGIDIKMRRVEKTRWEGRVSITEVEVKKFQVMNVKGRAVIDSGKLVVSDMTADAYMGKISGDGQVSFVPSVSYAAQGVFEGLDTAAMEEVNASLFSQLGDRISGAIEVQGLMGAVEHGHLDIGLNKDGEIQAVLLEPLLAYIPNSVQKKNIEAAIQKNSRVHVNSAALTLVDRNPETVSVDIRLKSAELSLDVNMVVDIIIEGGIQGLWKYFPSIFQLLKGS